MCGRGWRAVLGMVCSGDDPIERTMEHTVELPFVSSRRRSGWNFVGTRLPYGRRRSSWSSSKSSTTPRGGGMVKAPGGGQGGCSQMRGLCTWNGPYAPGKPRIPRSRPPPPLELEGRMTTVSGASNNRISPSHRSLALAVYLPGSMPTPMHAGTAEPWGVHRQRRWLTSCELSTVSRQQIPAIF